LLLFGVAVAAADAFSAMPAPEALIHCLNAATMHEHSHQLTQLWWYRLQPPVLTCMPLLLVLVLLLLVLLLLLLLLLPPLLPPYRLLCRHASTQALMYGLTAGLNAATLHIMSYPPIPTLISLIQALLLTHVPLMLLLQVPFPLCLRMKH
jgi:hypothetical protein